MSLLASAGTVLAAGSSALVDASGAPTTLGIFASEFFGTFILILLGAGVCAAVTLKKSYAKDAGWVVITFGWGLAVFTAVYLSFLSGAHLRPPRHLRNRPRHQVLRLELAHRDYRHLRPDWLDHRIR